MNSSPPTSPRPWLLAAALLALLALVVALERLGHSRRIDEPGDFDNALYAWVIRHRPGWPWVTSVLRVATRFGNPDVATLATAVVAFALYGLARLGVAQVRKSEALVWLAAILGGRLWSIGLKHVFRRDRPPELHRLVFEDTYSYPSGHSVFAAVFFTMLAAVLARMIPPQRKALRAATVAACLTLAVLIALSRVWLGVHYLSDVLGGLLIGFGWVLVVTLVRHVFERRRGATTDRGA
jgi:undecaprenyl-diphosphatase